jgi:GH35 family endo-1,4-beta-xylanase
MRHGSRPPPPVIPGLFALCACAAASTAATAAEPPAPPSLPPVAPFTFEAESGVRGKEIERKQDGGVDFITAKTNGSGGNPARPTRVVRYDVRFPAPGEYDLYARVRVGPGGSQDDSFFFAKSFGKKDPTKNDDWVVSNNLGGVGQRGPDDLVRRGGVMEPGSWNWVNVSTYAGALTSFSFTVQPGKLTQTLDLGMREDGLEIDKLAFGPARITHSVKELEQGLPGRYIPPPPPPPPYTPTGPALAYGHTKFLGGAYSPVQSVNFTAYFNQVTPENAGKWGSVEAERDVMRWDDLDAAYAFARKNKLPFKLHVLVWGNQQPAWIEQLSPQEQREEIEEWFQAVAERYPDLDQIEVVNEPLNDPPSKPGDGGGNYLEALGGTGQSGWDWILTAFRMARSRFPRSQLMINEFSLLNNARDAERYRELIELLKKEGTLDAVGIQAHAFETRVPNEALLRNLEQIAGAGLPIYITEFDVDGVEDDEQLADFQRLFPLLWQHPAVRGFTFWGYRPGMWRTQQGAFLAYENGAERKALVWLRQYLDQTRPKLAPVVKLPPRPEALPPPLPAPAPPPAITPSVQRPAPKRALVRTKVPRRKWQ